MNVEYYVQRPAANVVVQLSAADETEILALLDNPNLTITRDETGHWTFLAASGPDHEANDGDWVVLSGYYVGPADDLRASTAWQQVASADINYLVQ